LRAAQAEFAAGRARKTYWAVVCGVPEEDAGTIAAPLARRQTGRSWRMAVDPAGQPAVTRWRRRGVGADRAWLELWPETGRTHQVRAHCAALGHPVSGDAVYGGGTGPLLLLARALRLDLEPPVSAVAPPPAPMRAALLRCGWDPAGVP
jgi:23S rRNA-/tRNA-specific pseudouridylate synthase